VSDTDGIALLREEPTNPHLLRGYGPLAVGIVLLLLMTLLAPTVAREERVVRPRDTTTTLVRQGSPS
jgi:hypothetical protein